MKKIILFSFIIIVSVLAFFFVASRNSILSSARLSTTPPSPSSTDLSIMNVSLAVGTVGVYYGAGLGAGKMDSTLVPQGGNGSYEWSILSGKLPPGLHLGSSYTSSCGEPCSGYRNISGNPTRAGSYPVTFTVKSGGQTVAKQFIIVIQDAVPSCSPPLQWDGNSCVSLSPIKSSLPITTLSIVTTSLPAGIVGRDYEAEFVVKGGDGLYGSGDSSAESLPPGLSWFTVINPCSVAPCSFHTFIRGMPTAVGSYPLKFAVSSGGQVVSREFTIEINSN